MDSLAAAIDGIEAYDGLAFDTALAAELWETGRLWQGRPLRASIPSFKTYRHDDLKACCGTGGGGGLLSGAFPAFSITGGACALGCAHCGGRILEPMIAARSPGDLDRIVREMHARQGLRGFLLSGGSNMRNEVPFERYMGVVAQLKANIPGLEVAVHTGLVDVRRAALLAGAGVDVAMLDIIGAAETIREVYRLDRPVADFETSLAHLVAAGLDVVPHIVIGLHFGRRLGEENAIGIISRHRTRAVILVVLMPHLAEAGRFQTPSETDVARTILAARRAVPDRTLLLGCARPPGLHRRLTDAYAVLAGIDGIAYPADGAIALARALGRTVGASPSCCGVDGSRAAA